MEWVGDAGSNSGNSVATWQSVGFCRGINFLRYHI